MRLNISVEMRADDDIATLTEQILDAAGVYCDGSGAGLGYRDTEYDVPTVDEGELAGARVTGRFPDRKVIWDVTDEDTGDVLASSVEER